MFYRALNEVGLLLLVLFFVTNCSAKNASMAWPATVVFEESVPVQTQEKIRTAFIEIEDQVGEKLFFWNDSSPESKLIIRTVPSFSENKQSTTDSANERIILGRSELGDNVCDINLLATLSDGMMESVGLHEWGHCAGLSHVQDSSDLMFTKVNHPLNEYSVESMLRFVERLKNSLR